MKIIRNFFGPTQQQVIDTAFARTAKLDAECAEQATLIELYTALLTTIDHTTDWWSYAAAMQAKADAAVEYNTIIKHADAARDQCQALIGNNQDSL